jgi:hypothetical protein
MSSPCKTLLAVALLLCGCSALADSQPARMSEGRRMFLIRDLSSERVFIRRVFPMGTKGLTIKDGVVKPDEAEVQQMIAKWGPAVRPGDAARITAVLFKGDNRIIFEINGGPKKKKKWYEHLQIGGAGASVTPTDPTQEPSLNPRGSYVELVFDKYVPDLTTEQVKEMLRPVFDFSAKSAAEAYIDTLPAKVKEAIKDHQVLVGMNREMVVYAKGRAPRKIRERDGNVEYEEWIYGEPPKDVEFVRFVGDEVVRLEIMKVDGEKIVRTAKEIDLPKPALAQQQAPEQPPASSQERPTLRRPGEQPIEQPGAAPASPKRPRLPGEPTGPTAPPQAPPGGTSPLAGAQPVSSS